MLTVLDNGGKNIKLDQVEIIDMGLIQRSDQTTGEE